MLCGYMAIPMQLSETDSWSVTSSDMDVLWVQCVLCLFFLCIAYVHYSLSLAEMGWLTLHMN